MRTHLKLAIEFWLGIALFAFAAVGVRYVNLPFNSATRWALLAFLGLLLLSRRKLFAGLSGWIGVSVGIFLAWTVLSSLWSIVPTLSWTKSIAYVAVVICFSSAGYLYASQAPKRNLMRVLAPILLLVLISALFGTASFRPSVQVNSGLSLYRGLTQNPNFLGILILCCLPLALWNLYASRGKSWSQIRSYAVITIIMAILLNTYSRASILACSVLFMFFLFGNGMRRYSVAILVFTTVSISFFLAFPEKVQLLETRYIYKGVASAGSVFDSREHIWDKSLQGARQGGIFGIGFGASAGFTNFTSGLKSSMYGREKGNSTLAIIEEVGLLGLVLYCVMTCLIVFQLVRALSISRSADDRMLLSLSLGLIIALTLNAQFEAWLISPGAAATPILWAFTGMGLAIAKLVIQSERFETVPG